MGKVYKRPPAPLPLLQRNVLLQKKELEPIEEQRVHKDELLFASIDLMSKLR